MKPEISVIIPIYNVEDYLAMCLDSCAAQEFPGAEFICVDDGSTDSSGEILRQYADRTDSIKVISKENGGLSSARNAGLGAARGEWVMFLDSDDKLKPDALKSLQKYAATGADIIIYCADTFPADIESESWFKKTLQFPAASYNEFRAQVLFAERGAMPFVWRQAYRRNFLERSGVQFDETLKYGEDVQFQMEIFPHAKRFEFVQDVMYSYRLKREGSLMDSVNTDPGKVVDNHYEMIRHIAAYWKEQGWFEQYGADFLSWALKFTILKVRVLPFKLRHQKAAEMFDDIIAPNGLQNYKSAMTAQGKLMWSAFSAFKKI